MSYPVAMDVDSCIPEQFSSQRQIPTEPEAVEARPFLKGRHHLKARTHERVEPDETVRAVEKRRLLYCLDPEDGPPTHKRRKITTCTSESPPTSLNTPSGEQHISDNIRFNTTMSLETVERLLVVKTIPILAADPIAKALCAEYGIFFPNMLTPWEATAIADKILSFLDNSVFNRKLAVIVGGALIASADPTGDKVQAFIDILLSHPYANEILTKIGIVVPVQFSSLYECAQKINEILITLEYIKKKEGPASGERAALLFYLAIKKTPECNTLYETVLDSVRMRELL